MSVAAESVAPDAPSVPAGLPKAGRVAGRTSGRRRGIATTLAMVWLGAIAFGAVFADLLPISGYDQPVDVGYRISPLQHWPEFLGTDTLARSAVARVVYGARVSLAVGLIAASIGIGIGGALGLIAGYRRGLLEKGTDILADSILSIPPLVLLLAMRVIWSPSLPLLIAGLAMLTIPVFYRISRANTLTFSEREFVRAARALGARPQRIIFLELLPNIALPLMSYGVIVVGTLMVAEGSLSFLGLGIPPPTPSWGGMIQAGKADFATSPHLIATPGFVLFLTVLSLNTLGDFLRGRLQLRETVS